MRESAWTLWICGDGPERSALDRLTIDLGLQNRVLFKGTTSHEMTSRILASSSLYAQPNLGPESFGLAAAEASMLGIPVVGFDVPGLNETILNEKTGLLVSPPTPSNLAQAITRLLERPDWATEMGMRGREHVRTSFSESRHAQATLDAYHLARELFSGRSRNERTIVSHSAA